jgi:nucleotide-binding universal stress UspA family protein
MEPIVVGYNNTAAAEAALHWATGHAIRSESSLVVVYVASSIAEWELSAAQIDPDPIRHEFERRLENEWTAPVRKAGVPCRTKFTVGRAADELMRTARAENAVLIVIGMSPRGTLSELVWGSTQHELLHGAVRPVVAVPASWDNPPET